LPITLEYDEQRDIDFSINVPNETSIGQHSILIQLQVAFLSVTGWTTYPQTLTLTWSLEVTEQQPIEQQITFVQSNPETSQSNSTQPVEATNQSFSLFSILVLIILAAVVVLLLMDYSRRRPEPQTMSKSAKLFCVNCGTELPAGSSYCHKCGSKATL
jgi:hypothetical protein